MYETLCSGNNLTCAGLPQCAIWEQVIPCTRRAAAVTGHSEFGDECGCWYVISCAC